MHPYRVELAPSICTAVWSLPPSLAKRFDLTLEEIAESASELPPIGHPAWRRWRGLGDEAFSVSVGPYRVRYALEPSRRRVVVLGVELGDPLDAPSPFAFVGRAMYVN
jgi:mRNA-degrading endonuclease RelE of RelBE toxin-antitoxin system